MVKVREIERNIESSEWLDAVTLRLSPVERDLVARADLWAQQNYADRAHPAGARWIEHVRSAAGTLSALRVDGEPIAAPLLL